MGLVDPVFPVFFDDRSSVRYPGCIPFGDPTKGHDICQGGDAIWQTVPFHVALGSGGALMMRNPFPIQISDSEFRTTAGL